MTGRATVEALLSEEDFLQRILREAHNRQWLVIHYRRAQVRRGRWTTPFSGDRGAPDLLLARDGRVLLRELKREDGQLGPGQAEWLDALGEYGRIWRPSDWPQILEELQ